MLFYNRNIRRKTTYKIPVLFDEILYEKKEVYSYSIFTEEFREREIFFDEKLVYLFEYNPQTNFANSLIIYDEKGEIKVRYFFDIIDKKDSKYIHMNDSLILEFKESYNFKDKNVVHGYFEKIDNKHTKLFFGRVQSYLGYKLSLNLLKNEEGDFVREEYYDSETGLLKFILENKYEYYEPEIEKKAQKILKDGW